MTVNERSLYNLAMDKAGDAGTKAGAQRIARFFREKGRMPSYSEIALACGFKSKNSAFKLARKLEDMGLLARDAKGRLIPKAIKGENQLKAGALRMLGTVEAGFPSPAEEELSDVLSLDEMLITNRQATFMLKVSGDSMCGAGILPGDMVLVEKGRQPANGDIVVAEVDGQWTMKEFKKEKGSKDVWLMPANPKFKPIKPKSELRIAGVVTAVIRKYK